MIDIFIGGLLVVAGYLLCYFTKVRAKPAPRRPLVVERAVPSFKNPLKPYEKVTYENGYKKIRNADGLLNPTMPKKRDVKVDGRKG